MIEYVIEVVQDFSHRVVRMERVGLVVRSIKIGPEAAEQFGHSQVGFPVAVIAGRIEDDGSAALVHGMIASP